MKNNAKKILFMGTPYFAEKILTFLLVSGYNVAAVISQPDKLVGRKQVLEMTPVKKVAVEYNLIVFQPFKIKEEYQFIDEIKPDIILTCAYGQIIPKALIEKYLCINIHASLLPKLRGGAPMHRAIINGDDKTGVTIMRMAQKMDAGAIIKQKEVVIEKHDNVATLQEKLIICAQELLQDVLPDLFLGMINEIEQDESQVTFGYNINKDEEFISFDRDYLSVYNHIRGLIPWPIGYGIIDNVKIRFHEVMLSQEETPHQNGTLVGINNGALAIAVENRLLLIKKLQVEGRNIISAKDFINGQGKNLINKRFM